MLTGYITHFNTGRRFGFIDCPELDLKGIFFTPKNCHKDYKNPMENDRVHFEMERSYEQDFSYEATEVEFAGNEQYDLLLRASESGEPLKGILREKEGEFYVKDFASDLKIPLTISEHEVYVEVNYHLSVGKVVEYELTRFTAHGRIEGVLRKRTFSDDYKRAVSGRILQGYVLSRSRNGYMVKILNSITGIVPFGYTAGLHYQKNDPIELIGIGLNQVGTAVIFKPADYVERANALEINPPAKPVHRTLFQNVEISLNSLFRRASAMMF